MHEYRKMRSRQQEEFEALPVKFAFSQKQFNEIMAEWGLDAENDVDKIVRIPGGGFVRKQDQQLLHDTLDRFDREMKEAIEADETGDGFIYDMFLTELDDHEYNYTGDPEDALDALGLTEDDVLNDPRLYHGIFKAYKTIMRRG